MSLCVDIVIDTNVFVHADNCGIDYYYSAKEFLKKVEKSSVKLCLDAGFDPVESRNRSHIGGEYYRVLRQGTRGYNTLMTLVRANRYKVFNGGEIAKRKRNAGKLIHNSPDIYFLCVAILSYDHLLVSNDLTDFTEGKRSKILENFGVRVLTTKNTARLC
jgi:hypothetical protein